MDPKLAQSIIEDSSALVERTAKLAELADKVPDLERKNADLATQVGTLEKGAAKFRQDFSTEVKKVARRFVDRGALSEEKVAEFIRTIENDPLQIVDVMDKMATSATAVQQGGGQDDGSEKAAELDPIEKFVRG